MERERSSFGSIFAIGIILTLLVAGAVYAVRMRKENAARFIKTPENPSRADSNAIGSSTLENEYPHEDLSSDIDAELKSLEKK